MQQLLRSIYYALPLWCRKWIRRLYYLPKDLFMAKDDAIPPSGKNFTGSGDFIATGKEFFDYFTQFALIHNDSQILEIGCGMGRMALPFKDYLSPNGHYTGIDIVQEGIDWCKNRITPGDSRFSYYYAPIFNTLYNPNSKLHTIDYKLPVGDASIDFVLLTSVFTHLLPDEVSHYLSEINRVLKPRAKVFATFFIVKEVQSDKPLLKFNYAMKNHFLINKNIPEANVGYPEDHIYCMYKNSNLSIEKILYGSWSGQEPYTSFQDIVIAIKND